MTEPTINELASNQLATKDNDPQRYLIIGRARSGTTMTHLILMGHPQVAALNDELRPQPIFTRGLSSFTFGNNSPKEDTDGLAAVFDAVTQINRNQDTRACGAKTVINSPELAGQVVTNLRTYLPQLKIIHIVREDLAALFGSAVQGRKSGVMHSWYKDFGQRKIDKLSIPKARFYAFALNSLRTTAAVRQLADSHDYLEFNYEMFLEDRTLVETRLFEFLGLDQVAVNWVESQKVMPPPDDYITNYASAHQWNQDLQAYVANGHTDAAIERTGLLGRALSRLQTMTTHLKR